MFSVPEPHEVLLPGEKKVAKKDSTYTVLSVCVVINIFLIILVAYYGNQHIKGTERIASIYDFKIRQRHEHRDELIDRISKVDFDKFKLEFDKMISDLSKFANDKKKEGADNPSLDYDEYDANNEKNDHFENKESLVQPEDLQPNAPSVIIDSFNQDLSINTHSVDDAESVSTKTISHKKTFHLAKYQVNWTEAMSQCELDGNKLASINSPAEQAEILALIKELGLGHADFWTSGNDIENPGVFVWASTGNRVTYSNWNWGEPNNAWSHDYTVQEHCLSLVYDFNYRWNDSLCGKKKYFICEE